MLHVSHSFFYLVSSFVYGLLGLIFATQAYRGWEIVLGEYTAPAGVLWAVVGVCFIMSFASARLLK